jgi:hypothetical protein
MGFQVLLAASMKVTVFWDVSSCILVEIEGRFTDSASVILATHRKQRKEKHILSLSMELEK